VVADSSCDQQQPQKQEAEQQESIHQKAESWITPAKRSDRQGDGSRALYIGQSRVYEKGMSQSNPSSGLELSDATTTNHRALVRVTKHDLIVSFFCKQRELIGATDRFR
jgi:hypothetical protein